MQRYFAKEIINNKVILDKSDEHHITHVMRMKNNDEIEVVYDNKLYLASIHNMMPLDIIVKNECLVKQDKYPNIVLIIPYLKEQKMDLIFQKGTELGVNTFLVAPFMRSMIKYDERKEKNKLERWQKICKEASEQSMRIDIPNIAIYKDWNFISQIDALKLLCSTTEKDNNLKRALNNNHDYDTIALVIGPEGGIDSQEEDYLTSKGFQKITLGAQIMRVETVPIYVTSAIKYEYME